MLHQGGFVAASDGNLSVRTEEGLIISTPTGMSKGMMRPEDMVVINIDGTWMSGSRNVSSEFQMHLTIYKVRPDVNAVVHAHPSTATGFACAGIALDQPLCSEIVLTLGSVPLAPYATTGTPELSQALMPYVSGHNAVLMANHGAVTYGSTLSEAFFRMEAVEHFARIVLVAKQLGREVCLDTMSVEKLVVARERYQRRCSYKDEPGTELKAS